MVRRNDIDTLYAYGTGTLCSSCGRPAGSIFILARSQFKADSIRKKGGGLCGDCQCNNIVDTHGGVVTLPEFMNS